jgi:hypothetical protein
MMGYKKLSQLRRMGMTELERITPEEVHQKFKAGK